MPTETRWPNRRLEEVARINPESLGVGTPASFEFQYIDIASVTEGAVDWSTVRLETFATAPSRARRVVAPRDVLFCTVRPGLKAHTFADWPLRQPVICSTGFAVIRSGPELEPRYLSHLVFDETIGEQVRKLEIGSSYPAVNESDVRTLLLPLPPHNLQSHIADILDAADESIRRTEEVITKLKLMKDGLLHDLLTRGLDTHGHLRDPVAHPEQFKDSPLGRMPMDWKVDRLGLHILCIEQGWSPDCSPERTPPGQWGVLKTTAVVWNGYQDEENKLLPSSFAPIAEYEVRVGDVLITRGGPNSRVGVVAYVDATQGKLMLSDKIYRVLPKSSLRPLFLAMALSGDSVQTFLSTMKTGMAESQTNISQEIVKHLWIQVPSPAEQRAIEERVTTIDFSIKKEVTSLGKLKLQKSGLMHDLLTGRVSVSAAEVAKRA